MRQGRILVLLIGVVATGRVAARSSEKVSVGYQYELVDNGPKRWETYKALKRDFQTNVTKAIDDGIDQLTQATAG